MNLKKRVIKALFITLLAGVVTKPLQAHPAKPQLIGGLALLAASIGLIAYGTKQSQRDPWGTSAGFPLLGGIVLLLPAIGTLSTLNE